MDATQWTQFADSPDGVRRRNALGQRMVELQPREIAESAVLTPQRLDDAREERNRRFYEIYGLVDDVPKAEDFYEGGEESADTTGPSDSSLRS